MSRPNFYASGGIDRVSHLRRDEAWLRARLDDSATRVVPVWRSHSLMVMDKEPSAVLLAAAEARALMENGAAMAFLGLLDQIAHFAVDLSHLDDPAPALALAGRGAFVDLRLTGGLLDHKSGSLLAYARGLMHWHVRHRFCGACGAPTRAVEAGHMRVCANDACKSEHFPRTDPAVIMLVTYGESCLLGRQGTWPPGMRSTLAGFVEPGESLEDAVAREVFEETGVVVTDVRYNSSQPWPFPSSIMLGFHARALGPEIRINPGELEDARWYTREQLRHSPEDNSFRMPRRVSIARRLVDDWLEEPDL